MQFWRPLSKLLRPAKNPSMKGPWSKPRIFATETLTKLRDLPVFKFGQGFLVVHSQY
jgi:hypothetical protein